MTGDSHDQFPSLIGFAAPALFSEFRNASYVKCYNILCKKLIMERLFTDATVILSPQSASKSGKYSEMSKLTGLKSFVAGLAARVAMEAA